jgi:RimJ/RimL family protein N-acetyltransferase
MTAEEVETLCTGKLTKLYPYVRGLWPPETLFTLWQMMRDQDATEKVFFGRVNGLLPYPTTGDLVDFVKFFEPEPPQQRVLLLAQSQEEPDQVVGIFWFDDIVPGHRAAGSVLYRRRYWGEPAREASRLALAYGFEVLGVASIWAYSPWRTGFNHAEAAGMTWVATLPHYVIAGGQPMDLHILRIRREEFMRPPSEGG